MARAASIAPTPPPAPPPQLPAEVKKLAEAVSNQGAIVVPERSLRPHPIVAALLAEHERRRRETRHERDPILRALTSPPDWSETDHRRHRILDTLFKAAERQGLKVKEEKPRRLYFESNGEQIEFKLREKLRRVLRLPTAEEKRRFKSGLGGINMEATGTLLFSIETYLPSPLKRIWTETPDRPMEGTVGDILAALLLAGPLLAQRTREREEENRRRQEEEHRRRQEAERERQDDNRWRRFIELAEKCRQVHDVRQFLAMIEQHPEEAETHPDGKNTLHWLVWARERLAAWDPLRSGPRGVFEEILEVSALTYRDR
jgi:hypothetical protein